MGNCIQSTIGGFTCGESWLPKCFVASCAPGAKIGWQGGGEGVHEINLNPNGNHVFQTSIKRAFSDGHEIYDVILEAGPAWRNQHAMIFHDLKRTPSFFSALRF